MHFLKVALFPVASFPFCLHFQVFDRFHFPCSIFFLHAFFNSFFPMHFFKVALFPVASFPRTGFMHFCFSYFFCMHFLFLQFFFGWLPCFLINFLFFGNTFHFHIRCLSYIFLQNAIFCRISSPICFIHFLFPYAFLPAYVFLLCFFQYANFAKVVLLSDAFSSVFFTCNFPYVFPACNYSVFIFFHVQFLFSVARSYFSICDF